MQKNIFIFLLIFYNLSIFSQRGNGNICINAEPLCGSSMFSYLNTSGDNFAESGPDYGCLILQPNPSWFYFQISQDGDIQLQLEQSTSRGGIANLDIDFIAYGPFNDPTSACLSELTAANIVDCSRRIDFIEFIDITNAKTGEYYLLLLTNFSKQPGFITVSQTLGSASTNCNFFNPLITTNIESCLGNTKNLDATTTNATHYVWYEDDGTSKDIFNIISGVNSSKYNVSSTNVYRAEAYNIDNVLLETYEFDTNFFITPDIPSNITYEICDTFEKNDGVAQFDLTSLEDKVLNGLNPTDFSIRYYSNDIDAFAGNDKNISLLYTNNQPTETIYVRVENKLSTTTICYDVSTISLVVNTLPEFVLNEEYILCVNLNETEEIETPPEINTRLKLADYSFIWSLDDSELLEEINEVFYPTEEGEYSVEVTNRLTNCSVIKTTNVVLSEPPSVSTEIVTYAFIEENNIEVTATGVGIQEHEFSIDGGIWQSDSIFKNVSIGEHIITVRNLSGCGQTSVTITVMDYPRYFTPNNDGFNDTWNITGLKKQSQAKVNIYNRYGKLLKQLNSTSRGWDGSFNGELMPSNDYWFTVEYIEPRDGLTKVFKANFALKR